MTSTNIDAPLIELRKALQTLDADQGSVARRNAQAAA
jgi:hypothetical protein